MLCIHLVNSGTLEFHIANVWPGVLAINHVWHNVSELSNRLRLEGLVSEILLELQNHIVLSFLNIFYGEEYNVVLFCHDIRAIE